MKRVLIAIIAFCLAAPFSGAVPARPTPFQHRQPDGSVITLQVHGDEHFHWTTDAAGRIVEKDADGFFRPTGESLQALAARAQEKQQERNQAVNKAIWSSYENPPVTNFGDRKVLCLIANFSDKHFVVDNPNQHFTNMLNQEGYSLNGAIGSVRDYYIDNSLDQYRPEFDVYGPATLAHPSSYYAANDYAKVPDGILEAYELLKDQIDISDYDTDGDGEVDMVLFYYPGYSAAEGGGSDTIWPHQYSGHFGMMGDKSFVRYFCTSELQGSSGSVPAAIGATCHEFAHSLGLPDFYDTDYQTSGYNYFTTGPYDLMSDGCYNDNSRRPPYLSAVERNMLGWMDYPETITAPGAYTLAAVQNNRAYQFPSQVSGEYFVVEARNGDKWDASISKGMLLYHIDKSSRKVYGYQTAWNLWQYTNNINAYGGHPCFCLEPRTSNYASQRIFPGSGNVTSYSPTDWDGNDALLSFSGITVTAAGCAFTVQLENQRTVTGVVSDSSGHPLQGVEMTLSPSVASFAAAPSGVSGSLTCQTDANGQFALLLPEDAQAAQVLTARKDGYVPASANLTLSSTETRQDFTLIRQGEGIPATLSRYDGSLDLHYLSLGASAAAGMHYSAAELTALKAVGAQLKTVSFLSGALAQGGECVYVVVVFGNEMVLCKDVTDQYQLSGWNTFDISSENLVIPAGKDVVIGYGLTGIISDNPFYAYGYSASDPDAGYINRSFPNQAGNWEHCTMGDYYYHFPISATISQQSEVTFSTLGVSYIAIAGGTPKVVVAAGKPLRSTAWYLDGESVATPPAVSSLPAGAHTYMVRLNYYDGTSERVYYDIDVK